MKKVKFERPLDRFPFSRIGVSYFAEQAYCEKRVELWLRNPSSLVSVPAEIEKVLPEAKLQEELAACGTGLDGSDLAALLLLHELGHQIGKWGSDAGAGDKDKNLEHTMAVYKACF